MSEIEPFVVRHYTDEEGPIIKGNGFDGLRVGDTRDGAEAFVRWVNEHIGTAEQVRQLIAAERERCARLCEEIALLAPGAVPNELAAAIRSLT